MVPQLFFFIEASLRAISWAQNDALHPFFCDFGERNTEQQVGDWSRFFTNKPNLTHKKTNEDNQVLRYFCKIGLVISLKMEVFWCCIHTETCVFLLIMLKKVINRPNFFLKNIAACQITQASVEKCSPHCRFVVRLELKKISFCSPWGSWPAEPVGACC